MHLAPRSCHNLVGGKSLTRPVGKIQPLAVWQSICKVLVDMDPIAIAAAAGSRSRLESLEILANNIANASTAGFKADREFYGLYLSAEAQQSTFEPNRPSPTDLPEIEHHWTDYSQGSLSNTGNPLDLAIAGRGYFEVVTPGGPRWTRNGSFRVGLSGNLETQNGDALNVKPPPGREFKLDPNLPYEINKGGDVIQGGEVLGTIQLKAQADQSAALEKMGASYFKVDPAATQAASTGAQIEQGFLETSNFGPADAAVRLVNVMRQFEMLQKATNLGSEMNKKVIEEVGRA